MLAEDTPAALTARTGRCLELECREQARLVVSGPCEFRQRAPVSCEGSKDDFFVALTRKAKHGATLVAFLNVEHYHGPGSYEGGQMFVTVQSGTNTYRWSSDAVQATVSPAEDCVTLPETRLEAEPMLVNCTGLIGPASNYQYQCGGRSEARFAVETSAEIVSGKFVCAERPKEKEKE